MGIVTEEKAPVESHTVVEDAIQHGDIYDEEVFVGW